jgi:hypothetical protein
MAANPQQTGVLAFFTAMELQEGIIVRGTSRFDGAACWLS